MLAGLINWIGPINRLSPAVQYGPAFKKFLSTGDGLLCALVDEQRRPTFVGKAKFDIVTARIPDTQGSDRAVVLDSPAVDVSRGLCSLSVLEIYFWFSRKNDQVYIRFIVRFVGGLIRAHEPSKTTARMAG